jgi:sigma-B regulation protein RsbU (phosphoserine phosphatase)
MFDILLVDDSRTTQLYMGAVLKKRGYRVKTASDGETALQILSACDEIQFVLSDWVMPGMNGIELCRQLKRHDYHRYIFFVLLSSKSDPESIVDGIDAGADDFVDKRTSVDELVARVKAGFRTLNLHREILKKNQQLDLAYQTIKTDLDAAGEMLRHMMPKNRTFPCVELGYVSVPSAQIGGDMLGYMQLDCSHVAFYLLDVAGHGVASALMSFSIQQSLSALKGDSSIVLRPTTGGYEIAPPEDVVAKLNRMYLGSASQTLYFTMSYAVLNTQSGLVSYCCAGHPPLIWCHSRSGAAEFIGHDNFVVGAFEDIEYQSSIVQLQPGDKIWFYSDGITEAENGKEQFSEDGLKHTIESLNRYPTQLQTEMLLEVVKHWAQTDSFMDDVSVLVAEWKGPPEGENQCDMKLVNKATAQFFK